MQIEFLGHAGVLLQCKKGSLVIDPFIKDNPLCFKEPQDIKVDWILLTHGHGDHFGDALTIASNNQGQIIAPFELAKYCESKGCTVHPMHIGGSHEFPFGRVKLTPALHGSAVFEGDKIIYTGQPCGFLLNIEGKWIYHAGDTGIFSDMQLYVPEEGLDLAFLPIGDNFVMGLEDAARATALIKPKTLIPIHYDTFPLIEQDPQELKPIIPADIELVILKPGEQFSL